KVDPPMPALMVPPPPPRVLPPLEGERIDAATAVPNEPQAAPRQATRPRTEAPRAAGSEPPRGENRGEPGQARGDGASTSEGTAQHAPSIQLASPGDLASEQHTRSRLAQAAQDLQRVDYRQLNADARAQYDIAKRFIALAEQAINDRNLLYARTLADKAATIAGVLQRR
ncbi:MAG TPA: hypothetical protein VNK41_10035, partial [Vicinamibacterales bacterium]|nr:hypothetical protein [Vicinamibacterales bacterium]